MVYGRVAELLYICVVVCIDQCKEVIIIIIHVVAAFAVVMKLDEAVYTYTYT